MQRVGNWADEIGEAPQEECGIFGVYGPGEDVARVAYFGLFALQHRGQESAGIAVANGERLRLYKDMGLVTQVFDEDVLGDLDGGHIAIGHTRYSTTGSSVKRNAQPLTAQSPWGELAVAHNGNLVNTKLLRNKMKQQGVTFETTNDSEVITKMLATAPTETLEDAVRYVMERVEGAYSLLIMSATKMIGVRDPYGVRPLCLGQLRDGHYVVASETCAITVVGGHFLRDVEPGEIIVVDASGVVETEGVSAAGHATCIFEFIYFARPDSRIYDKTLYMARKRMGHELAREHPCPDAHLVMPIPDSAIPASLGYAEASRTPYAEGLVKNRYIHRTFIQPDQRMRDLGVLMKFTPLKDVLAGRKIVMVDDSIVRGTTTGKLVRMLFDAGAAEVHVRITSPPVRWPCFYGIDMAKQKHLIAARMSVDGIREEIGATTLGYLSLDGVVRAIGLHKNKFCRACFDGHYPIKVPKDVRLSKMMLEGDECDVDPEESDSP